MRVEEERKARAELVDVHAAIEAGLDVLHAVAQRKGEFLRRGRAGLADVVTGDGHGIPLGHVLRLVLDGVDDQLDRGLGRVDVLVLGVELLEDVVLQRAAEGGDVDAPLLGHGDVHRPDDAGGAVDGLGDGDLIDRDVGVEPVHVLDGVDGHAAAPDLAGGQRVVGVAPHQRRQVEGRGKPGVRGGLGLGLLQQVLEALVGVVGGAEARELAHGPEPGAIALREQASRVGELAGSGQIALDVCSAVIWLGSTAAPGPYDGFSTRPEMVTACGSTGVWSMVTRPVGSVSTFGPVRWVVIGRVSLVGGSAS